MKRLKIPKYVYFLLCIVPVYVWFYGQWLKDPNKPMFRPLREAEAGPMLIDSTSIRSKDITLTTEWYPDIQLGFNEHIDSQMKTGGVWWQVRTDGGIPQNRCPIDSPLSGSNYLGSCTTISWRILPGQNKTKGQLTYWITRK